MPSSEPPIPGFQQGSWSVPSGCNFALVGGSTTYGRFYLSGTPYYVAAVDGGTVGEVNWAIDSTLPAGGNVECLFTSTAANIMKSGTVNADKTISYGGVKYKAKMVWDVTDSLWILNMVAA